MFENVAVGVEALRRNTTGTANVAIGTNALVFNTTGVSNVAIGQQAGQSNIGGSGNVIIGTSAARNVTGPSRSVVIGEAAMVNSTGSSVCNVGVGWSALENVTGNNNTALGTAAGAFITTGGNNVAIGYCAQVPFGNQFNQLAIGYNAGCNWLTGDGDKHIRPGAGIRDCTGSLGTAGQVLSSTGAAIQWSSASSPIQRTFIPSIGFPNGASTIITFAPDTNNGRAVQFWITGVKTNDGRAQLVTGTWIRDFGNNIYDTPWASGSPSLISFNNPGSGTPGIRVINVSGANMNLNVAWVQIWS
jgi:hypothetical protein